MESWPGLLAIAGAVYLIECGLMAPAGAVVWQAPWGAGTRARRLRPALELGGAGLHVAPVLPAWRAVFVVPRAEISAAGDAASQRAALRARFDLPAIAAQRSALAQRAGAMRGVGAALFAVVFVATPVLLVTGRFGAWWPAVLGTALLLHVGAIAAFAAAWRALHAAPAPRGSLWKLAFSPFMTMRASDLLSRGALAAFDPLAVAFALGDFDTLEALARAEPASPVDDATRLRHERVAQLLRAAGLAGAPAPPPLDAASLSWCPSCGAQYRVPSGLCTTCEVRLVPFDTTAPRARERAQERLLARWRRIARPGAR